MVVMTSLDEPVEIVDLARQDVGDICRLFDAVIHAVARPDAVRPDEPSFFEQVFDVGGEILGLTCEGRLIAYGVLRPELASEHDRKALDGVAPADSVLFVVDGSAVHPDYWARALQRVLIRARIERAVNQGAETVIAKVSPNNLPSTRNLLKEGFRIVGRVRKPYGWRYIHHRSALAPPPEADRMPDIWRAAADIDAVTAEFEAGRCATRFRFGEDAVPELGFVER
ncbi:N-acetyltransferase family protein [Amorphus sp. 3PC139-8]|uniref:GNAT family N-acetyltransferase n=1 Tax=Amorphus sp. 3PC139-8 TaxID=2735676 RepID=UPI00345C7638